LKKLDGITVNKVVIFVQAVALDRILCFAYSDGSFEYRDRASLAESFTEGGPDRFIHLSQIGFSYEDEEPCRPRRGFEHELKLTDIS
jgi:mediator of RNA polymerase II transcription subunit 16, fungi type